MTLACLSNPIPAGAIVVPIFCADWLASGHCWDVKSRLQYLSLVGVV